MRVAGSTFDSGLGVHSKCVLHYDVGGKFAAFRAKVGIDDETLDLPRKGSVVFRVAADGKNCGKAGSCGAANAPSRSPSSISAA